MEQDILKALAILIREHHGETGSILIRAHQEITHLREWVEQLQVRIIDGM